MKTKRDVTDEEIAINFLFKNTFLLVEREIILFVHINCMLKKQIKTEDHSRKQSF